MAGGKQEFVLNNNSLRILLCGPTVYDYSHIGHARMLLFYDFLARYFRFKGAHVRVIVNITDIDYKIFVKARSIGLTPQQVAVKFLYELLSDISSLGIEGFGYAQSSGYVDTAQKLIWQLTESDKAYFAGGNAYLDTTNIASYGMLAKMTKQDLSDCRLDISPSKRSPTDILLWNSSENFDRMFHTCALGTGIPWWHMQDSSVAVANYNGVYDIHGGASELVYPHHECHLAQLKAITSLERPVRYWTHVGLVKIKGKKMSKSLGNTITIRELLNRYGANPLRLYLYSKNYREEFDFVEKELKEYQEIDNLIRMATSSRLIKSSCFDKDFFNHIEDDFDTLGALKTMIKAADSYQISTAMVNIFGLKY